MSYQRAPLRICLILLLLTINDVINLETTQPYHDEVNEENRDGQSANSKGSLIKSSRAEFLLSIYENNSKKKSEKELTGDTEPTKFDSISDVIMAFKAQRSNQEADGTADTIWFDTHSSHAQVTLATLKLYRGQDVKDDGNRGSFTVTVYRLSRTEEDGERHMHLVDSIIATAGHEGWLTLNVTESLKHWIKYPDDNEGLRVSVHPIDTTSHEARPEDIGIVGLDGDASRQPFLVGFFRSDESYKPKLIQSTPWSFVNSKTQKKKRHAFGVKTVTRDTDVDNPESPGRCQVKRSSVIFNDMGWDWIISPDRFNMNYCSGTCQYPLIHQAKVNNHAIVQSLANLMHPDEVPPLCCVPTNLSSIDILYYRDDGTIVMEKLKDMSVESCGCY